MHFKAEGAEVIVRLEPTYPGSLFGNLSVNGAVLLRGPLFDLEATYRDLREALRKSSVALCDYTPVSVPKDRNTQPGRMRMLYGLVHGRTVGPSLSHQGPREAELASQLLASTRAHSAAMVQEGRRYGYPECCIQAFVDGDHLFDTEPRKLHGTGYVPCAACDALRTEAKMVEVINSRRYKCLKPFSKDQTDEA